MSDELKLNQLLNDLQAQINAQKIASQLALALTVFDRPDRIELIENMRRNAEVAVSKFEPYGDTVESYVPLHPRMTLYINDFFTEIIEAYKNEKS